MDSLDKSIPAVIVSSAGCATAPHPVRRDPCTFLMYQYNDQG